MPFPRARINPVLWSPDLAYVVGLIATDGNLSSDGRHITIRSNDRPILDICRKILQKPTTAIAETHSSGFTTNLDPRRHEWYRASLTQLCKNFKIPLRIP